MHLQTNPKLTKEHFDFVDKMAYVFAHVTGDYGRQQRPAPAPRPHTLPPNTNESSTRPQTVRNMKYRQFVKIQIYVFASLQFLETFNVNVTESGVLVSRRL